jgi:putative transcriptional regulator
LIKVNLDKIRECRKSEGLSQEEVAKILGFNTVYPYHRKESGQQSFTAEELMKLAQLYNLSYENFFIFDVAKNEIHKKELT